MRIEQELTIYTAAALKSTLLAEVARAGAVDLDVSRVTEIDSAGLQLLLLAMREATAAGKPFRLLAPHAAVLEALATTGLDTVFDDVITTGAAQ